MFIPTPRTRIGLIHTKECVYAEQEDPQEIYSFIKNVVENKNKMKLNYYVPVNEELEKLQITP